MKGEGQILLVSTYDLGHQPFSLASPLAFFFQAGYAPRAVDSFVEPVSDEAVRRARLIAISTPMHTALRLAEPLARRARTLNPAAHLTFFGLYAWLNASYLLDGLADSVIGGEFEEPLLDLARSLETGAPTGLGVRWPDRPGLGPRLARTAFPIPRREALPPLERYAGLERNDEVLPAGYVEASRGCKHVCRHCPITPVYGGRFFVVPADVVLADIRNQVRAGARHITFGDPDFLNGPGHSLKIARAMHREFPDVTFDATIKIEHVRRHADLFPELKALGCAFVVSAVESLSNEVLRHLGKGHTAADVGAALAILGEACIPMRPSLVSFTPWTTIEDYLAVLEFVRARALIDAVDPIQYAIRLLIPPGSPLLNDETSAAWLGPLDPAAFSYRWTHPDPRMDALHAEVTAIVEHSVAAGHDPRATFRLISEAAYAAADRPLPPFPPGEVALGARPPRLTEPWFC